MYWFWDWVRNNRSGFTGTGVGTYVGDVLGTGTVPGGPTSLSLSTTGVTAGTYGGPGTFAKLGVDAKGRITAGTRFDLGAADPILNTSGTLSHNTSGVSAGTYGTGGTMVPQVTVDDKGHVTAVSNVGITFPGGGGGTSTATFVGDALGTGTIPGGAITLTLSTTGVSSGVYGGTAGFARFDISPAGRVLDAFTVVTLGSTPILITVPGTGTVAFGHNTSGATAGTFGTGGTMVSQVTVDVRGHVTAISNVGITFPGGTGGGLTEAQVAARVALHL